MVRVLKEYSVKPMLMKIAAVAALVLAPAIAEAAEGYATANVNMRAGPSTQYPAVTVIPAGESVEIHGCLADVPWCDVEFYGGRGWVAGAYVQAVYQQRRVYVGPEYYRPLGIPTVVFSVGNYWDRYYRDRNFYHERDRWRRNPVYDRPPAVPGRGPGPGPGYDRGPGPRPGYDRGPDRRPDFGSQPDRRPNSDRGPDRRPDAQPRPGNGNAIGRPGGNPDFGSQPDRRPDMQGRPGNGRPPEFDRNRNRDNVQRPPQGGRDAGHDRGNQDRRRHPACAPGDQACRDNQR